MLGTDRNPHFPFPYASQGEDVEEGRKWGEGVFLSLHCRLSPRFFNPFSLPDTEIRLNFLYIDITSLHSFPHVRPLFYHLSSGI